MVMLSVVKCDSEFYYMHSNITRLGCYEELSTICQCLYSTHLLAGLVMGKNDVLVCNLLSFPLSFSFPPLPFVPFVTKVPPQIQLWGIGEI